MIYLSDVKPRQQGWGKRKLREGKIEAMWSEALWCWQLLCDKLWGDIAYSLADVFIWHVGLLQGDHEEKLHLRIVYGGDFLSPATSHVLFPFGQNLPCRNFISCSNFQLLGLPDPCPEAWYFTLRLEVVGEAKNFRHAAGQPGCGVVALTFPGQVTLASVGFRFVDQAYKLQWVQEVGSGKGIWEGSCNFYWLQHICCEQRMSVSPSSYFFTFLAKVIF